MEKDHDAKLAAGLMRSSRALDLTTIGLILLVSPLSSVIALPLGVDPQTWLTVWVQYVFVFVVLALVIAVLGFAAASSYRMRARAIRRSIQES